MSRVRLALTLAFLLAVSLALRGAEVSVFAAASLQDALTEIARGYEKQSGDKVVFNFAASSTLARQIEQGGPADLFFSADEEKMDSLERKGLLLAGTRRSVLTNTLVIVVPADSSRILTSAADLAKPAIKRIALGEPSSVPAGIYAREYLEKLGLWATLKEKVVPTESVRAALAAVESGNVEAGIVYKTDARISRKVRVAVEIPATDGPKITYPLAIVKGSNQVEAAKRFAARLSEPAARAVFERYGFGVLQ
jgi:molybdate transport system substrate-binding protein